MPLAALRRPIAPRLPGPRAIATIALLLPPALGAQDWRTVHQPSTWLGTFVDHALTPRTALWFDGQWRRMGIGADPQQLLLRPGVQVTLAPGVRIAGGYAYIATAPYGEVPTPTPLREHRAWQQLLLSHRAGSLALTHRYRWEQRWLAPVGASGIGRFAYQQRARYMVRAQGDLPALRLGDRPVLGFVWNELLMPVGHSTAAARLTQNRIAAGVGVPAGARQRLEVSYLNLWNALPGPDVNEVNHTLSIAWVWTATR